MNIGETIRKRRLELGLSLRAFCAKYDEDPSNWSKLERGIHRPPDQYERLFQIARNLNYTEDSTEMEQFFQLAAIGRGEIPVAILENTRLKDKLPVIFRTMMGTPTEEELMRLADIVRSAHLPDD